MKTLRKFLRFSPHDQELLERAIRLYGAKSETEAIRRALISVAGDTLIEEDNKIVRTNLSVQSMSEEEKCPYEDWTVVPSQGWDSESGTAYIVIKRPVKPFDTKIVKEGEPWYYNLLEKKK